MCLLLIMLGVFAVLTFITHPIVSIFNDYFRLPAEPIEEERPTIRGDEPRARS